LMLWPLCSGGHITPFGNLGHIVRSLHKFASNFTVIKVVVLYITWSAMSLDSRCVSPKATAQHITFLHILNDKEQACEGSLSMQELVNKLESIAQKWEKL
jgi:hypothetical protein